MFETASGPPQASGTIMMPAVAGTGAGRKPRGRAGMLALELSCHLLRIGTLSLIEGSKPELR
jgi:hypothetical protein